MTEPTTRQHPLDQLRMEIAAIDPSGETTKAALAAWDVAASEWNAMADVVTAAGEVWESRDQSDVDELMRVFGRWHAWITRGVPVGAWLVEPTPEERARQSEQEAREKENEVPF